jgi:hypothetical protein
VDINGVAKGFYQVVLTDETGAKFAQKVIIE